MTPTPAVAPINWLLRSEAGDEVALTLAWAIALGVSAVAVAQQRQPESVVAQILDVCIRGRLQTEVSPIRPKAAFSSGAFGALVHTKLVQSLQHLAEVSGQAPGAYGVALLTEALLGAAPATARPSEAALSAPDEAKVRTWLSDPVCQALQELADLLGMSSSDVMRNSVYVHLFGRLAYEHAVAAGAWQPSRRHDGPMFSEQRRPRSDAEPKAPRTALIEQIGKADTQLTVFMPTALKDELQATAQRTGLRTSEYLRRHLATYLLGRLAVDALPLQVR